MQDITLSITHTTEYEQLLRGLQGGKTTALAVGLPPVSKAQLAAALHLETGRPVLLLTDDEGAVRRLADDLETFAEKHVLRVPERDFVMLGVESSSRQYEQARISALWHLARRAACRRLGRSTQPDLYPAAGAAGRDIHPHRG